MPFIPAGYGNVTIEFVITGGPSNPVNVTLGYINTLNLTANIAAAQIGDEFTRSPGILDYVDNAYTLTTVTARQQPGDEIGVATYNVTGRDTGNGSPPQVAVLVRKVTALGGRRNRGRMFLPGVPELWVNEQGLLSANYVTGLQGAFDQFIINMDSQQTRAYLLHSGPGFDPVNITAMVVQPLVATQRRRLRG
jgi:hypothetical protein